MGSLVLSAAGGAVGGALFGPAGAIAGRLAGAIGGSLIDQSLFAPASTPARTHNGPRLRDLDLTASTEGAPIPRVYGRVRVPGQVIWATALEEKVKTRTETTGGGAAAGGKGGGGAEPEAATTRTFSYFANIAVALSEGPVAQLARVWADGKPLDLSRLDVRFYSGNEDQPADPLIVAKEGADNAPAYRGLC
jgi:hypothetical protein